MRGADVRAFTLVELLIVVVILGILAAIVIPQFSDASGDAKISSITSDLLVVRRQIGLYRLQHNGSYPPFAQFEVLMTSKSNADGTLTGTPAYGPYIPRLPINPFTNGSDLGTGACGSSSWFYDESTGEFRPNCHAAHCPL